MRYRRVKLSGVFLTKMFTEGLLPAMRIVKGLPHDCVFAYSIPDYHYGVWIVIQHESFDLLKDGDEIPIHPEIVLERVEP